MEQETETTNKKLISNNGWQNIGICYQLAEDKIPEKYIVIYMAIVKRSFGYTKVKTNRYTVKQWCEWIGIGKDKFIKGVKWLEENGLIKKDIKRVYEEDENGKALGGSYANAYIPVFPHKIDNKYAQIKINKDTKTSKEDEYDDNNLRDKLIEMF